MGGVYTIYSYFNSEQIQGVLNAIVMLVGSGGTDGDYLSIVRVAAMLGLFLAVTYGFVKARGEDAGYYLLMVAIFYSTLFVPRVTVTIEERGGAGGGAPLVVANVPIGLAFFASTTSHIGSWLTERTETFFSLPSDELKLQKNGLMGGSRALRNLQSASFQDPILAQDLIVFMRECVNPELLVSPSYVETLLKSNSIWTEIGPAGLNLINPGRMVSLIGEAGAISCSEAYTNTTPRINAQATKEHGRIATLISPSATPTTADAILTALIPAQESLIMTASASTADAIKQRMMINMLNDAPSGIASMMNDPAAAQIALGASAATSSANTAYAVMAKLAQETLPVIRNAIELVIIGVFPIILLLIIIAGSKGGIVLRSYVMTMLWVQLWAPLYAIVNYVGVMAASKSMKAALAGVDGVCVMNAAQLLNSTISAEGIAGMLTISVPMIALALVKGGEVAMSGVTSGLSAPSNSAASSVGSQIGMGNVSMGNTSWGNHSSNSASSGKYDTNFAHRSGMAGVQDNSGNFMSYAPDGSRRVAMLTNSGGVAQNTASNTTSTLQQAAEKSLTAAKEDLIRANKSLSTALGHILGDGSNFSDGNSRGGDFSTTGQSSDTSTQNRKVEDGHTAQVQSRDSTNIGVRGDGDLSFKAGTEGDIRATSPGTPPAGAVPNGQPVSTNPVVPSTTETSPQATGTPNGSTAVTGTPPQAQPQTQGKARVKWNFGGGLALSKNITNSLNKAISSGNTASAIEAVNDALQYAKTLAHKTNFGNQKTGGDTRRAEVTAALNDAQEKVNSAAASLREAQAFAEKASATHENSAGISFNAAAMMDGDAYLKRANDLANSGGGKALANKLQEIRESEIGSASLPSTYGSGKPVLDEQGLKALNEDNKSAEEVNPDIRAINAANRAQAGAGKPIGKSAVGITPNEKLQFLDAQSKTNHEIGKEKIRLTDQVEKKQDKAAEFSAARSNFDTYSRLGGAQAVQSAVVVASAHLDIGTTLLPEGKLKGQVGKNSPLHRGGSWRQNVK